MAPRLPGGGPFRPFRQPTDMDTLPRVSSVSPTKDRIAGGVSATITGFNFRYETDGSAPIVRFGGVAATSVVVVNSFTITCLVPAAAEAAVVDVTVTSGSQTGTLSFGFTYYAATILTIERAYGPIAGNTEVTLVGANFDLTATYVVQFGGTNATLVTVLDAEHIVVTTPNHAQGFVDVVLLVGVIEHARLRNGFQFTLLTRGQDIRRNPGITVRDVLNNVPNTATFRVDGASNSPKVGEKIEILDEMDASRVLFRGNVQSAALIYEEQIDQLAWDTTAIDCTWLFNKYRPFGTYKNVSVSDIVTDLVSRFAPGFTTAHVQTRLAKVSITFDGSQDFSTCLNRLAIAIGGGHWYCDYTQDVHFFHNLPTNIIIPQSAGPISAMTVAEGAAIPAAYSFTAGYYLFRSTNVFDNGVESAIGPYSNAVALQGTKQISFTNIPVGVAVGTHVVAKRRIYYQFIGPGVITELAKFCEITDNVTTNFTTWFNATGASTAAVVAIAATVALPPVNRTTPPAAPASTMSAAQGTAAIYVPPNPPFSSGVATSYTPGRWAFKVSSVYQDGSESLPSAATASVTLDGALSAALTNIPIGPAVGGITVVARKIYASFGPTHQRSLAEVVALLNSSKSRGTIDADWGGIIGHGDSAYLYTVPIPTTYYDLAMIIGFGDLDAMMNVFDEPDWSPDRTSMWALINDNTTTSIDAAPRMGAGSPLVDSANASNIPVWPNADGPSLEETNRPDDITDSSTTLLKTPAFSVTEDQSQIRNRVYILGAGTSMMVRALPGDTTIRVADLTVFSPSGGRILTGGQRLTYINVGSTVGAGVITLSGPLTVAIDAGEPVNLFYQADDLGSQRERAKIELDVNGLPTDGVHEHMIVDTSLRTQFQMYMRAYAELELFAWPIMTARYGTRDPNTRSGKIVSIDLTDPPCKGDFLIQEVTIDQIHDESDQLTPRYTVVASSVKYELNDLLLSIFGGEDSNNLAGLATSSFETTKTSISAQAGTVLYSTRYITSAQLKAMTTFFLQIIPPPGAGKITIPLWGLVHQTQVNANGTSAVLSVRHATTEGLSGDNQPVGTVDLMTWGTGSGGTNAAQDRYYYTSPSAISPVRATSPMENRAVMLQNTTPGGGDVANLNHAEIRIAYLVVDDPRFLTQ